MTDKPEMTPEELSDARARLGLTVSEMARLLDTDPQSWRRMTMDEDATTFRKPAPRMVRLIKAYLKGYRPKDWPKDVK